MMQMYVKVGNQIRIKSSFLWMFTACFITWQMGVLYYSGTTMSLFGRTPIPLTEGDTTAVIAFGYLASILFICLFPRKVVYAERVVLPCALAATILMFFSFPVEYITFLFYIAVFGCVFSIGGMVSIASHLFTVDTTWKDGIIGLSIGGICIAVLQNDLFEVNFTVFMIFSVFMIFVLTLFHFMIPAKIEIPFAGRKNKVYMPKILFYGVWILNAFATLLLCFAATFAEGVRHGTTIIYLSAAFLAIILGLLCRHKGKKIDYSIKTFGVLFMVTVAGFIIAYFSIQVPSLQLFACVLLGCNVFLAGLWIFFCAVSFRFYPTRFVGAIGAGLGLVLAIIHSGLIEVLREEQSLLYGIYAVLSVLMMLVYYFLEPYFTYAYQQFKLSVRAREEKQAKRLRNHNHPNDVLAVLSNQERVLAELILKGYTESVIAREMNITINTQKSYRKNLYAKLDIHSKRELFERMKQL